MRIKDFKSYNMNENSTQDYNFTENVVNNYGVKETVKSIITLACEDLGNINVENIDDLKNTIDQKLNIDETSILDFDLNEKLDLCIYVESITNDKCLTKY